MIGDFLRLSDSQKRIFCLFLWENYKDLLEYTRMTPNERKMETHGSGKYGETFKDV